MTTPLERWVEEQARLTKPKKIYWCDGTEGEAHRLMEIGMTEEQIGEYKIFYPLNPDAFPNSYFHRSHCTDVARTEHLTYVCYPDKETAGPNNNWMEPTEAKNRMTKLFDGCMKGRTMYVLPYMMGHPDSPYAKACVQLTDVSYVAVSMRIMTRMGKSAIDKIGSREEFVRGIHSVGDFNPDRRFIMHFPLEELVMSVGSGYGGNALLGKKCFSLRIASWLGLREQWLAEHMIIIGIEDPEGNVTYVAAALPSACGKTNLAMLRSTLPGYKVWTLGDDIAWLNVGSDGRLRAINPETGLFGVAPGTSMKTNPNMLLTLKKGTFFPTLFTNTALNADTNEPWWEGMDGDRPENLIDWQGKKFAPGGEAKAAHPNSRFTVSISHCPTLSPEQENPRGVPISAIIFGGKRTHTIPLVYESFDWINGVFSGSRMGSETTSAAAHQVGVLRRDPMAMLPFCGYNMADYFSHWIKMGAKLKNPPKIFFVNWFRIDENGKFIWPGFGENIRVLKWIIERVNKPSATPAKETPIGLMPDAESGSIELDGLEISKKNLSELFRINNEGWKKETEDVREFYSKFGDRMPPEIISEFEKLKSRL